MKSKLLLTTAVLSVAIGAGGIAAAQDRDRGNDRQSIQQDRMHNQTRPSESRRPQTTGQAPSSTQSPSSGQTQNAPAATTPSQSNSSGTAGSSRSGTAQSTQPSTTRSPSSAQTNQPSTTNQPSSAQSNQPSTTHPSSAQTNPPPSTRQPSSAQTAPSNQTRQPSTATGQTGRQPSTAQQPSTTTNRQAGEQGERGTRLSASLQGPQRTRLTAAVGRLSVKPVTHVNFSVSVGTVIPTSVTLHPVPSEIVTIIPEYRGYDYFMVRDEVVIVEPRSHRIVDVIERGAGARAQATSTTTKRKLSLSSHDRQIIRKHYSRTTTGSAPRTRTKITVGEEVPESVEIHSFPEEVYRDVPAVREYRYIEGDRGTYVVEPGSRRVIEEIDDE